MQPSAIPFNISILQLNDAALRGLKPVKVLDRMEGSSSDYHEDGLFSTSIFGRVGDERRSMRYSYIDIKISVFHPIIYQALVKTKRLYADILAGTKFARWDEELKDFVAASALDGETGFHFFLQRWEDIEFKDTGSTSREQNILLIQKYKKDALTSKIVVMPAGLRDMDYDDHGRASEDEINPMYRRLLSLSNTITAATVASHPEMLNNPRHKLQLAFNAIYDYLSNLVEGKSKLFMGKFASRRIFNGTRNVISAMDPTTPYLGGQGGPDFNSTMIGLYQYLKANVEINTFQIRDFLQSVFPHVNEPAQLINRETLKAEEVLLASRYYDQWATNEGVKGVITGFKEETRRDVPLMIDGRYVFLIYKGPDKTFKIMRSIEELPANRDPKDVHPMTLTELMYLSVYRKANTFPIFVTRYPVTGVGSIYPSRVYLRPTLKTEQRVRLDENWEPMSDDNSALEFPVAGAHLNTLVPHPSRIRGLGADKL